jgi:hypothetical protein
LPPPRPAMRPVRPSPYVAARASAARSGDPAIATGRGKRVLLLTRHQ